jgi:hypothetical protein
MIDSVTRDVLINKMLEQYNVTIQEIRKEHPDGYVDTGIVKNKKPVMDYWYNKYVWDNEEKYFVYRGWAEHYVTSKNYSIDDLNWFEATYDLKHSYIFKKEGELF